MLASSDRFAVQLSEWAGAGDWRLFFLHRDRVEKVTAADVNRVAAKYLTRTNRTVGVYYPTTKPERAHIPGTPSVAKLVEGYKGREGLAAGESFDPTPENIEKRVARGEMGSIKTAFLSKKTRGEMVNVRLHLRYGNEESLAGLVTAAGLLPDMLPRGTKSHTRQQITDTFSKLGATVSFGGGTGLLTVFVKVKRENLPATLKLVGEILREPSFPQAELEILKREELEQLNKNKTDPIRLGINELQRKMQPYPKDNIRYVPTIDESIERLNATSIDKIKTVYGQLGAQAGELVAVGDFDPKTLSAELRPALESWKSTVAYKRIEQPAIPLEKGETIVINTPDKANALYVSGLTYPMTDTDPEYPAMQVGNFLLGGAALASRLSNRVRGDKGL
jgi:zinc protease